MTHTAKVTLEEKKKPSVGWLCTLIFSLVGLFISAALWSETVTILFLVASLVTGVMYLFYAFPDDYSDAESEDNQGLISTLFTTSEAERKMYAAQREWDDDFHLSKSMHDFTTNMAYSWMPGNFHHSNDDDFEYHDFDN